jgi:hypothetical protein
VPWRRAATPNFAMIANKLVVFVAPRTSRHLSLTGGTGTRVGATAEPFLRNGHNAERGPLQDKNKLRIADIVKIERHYENETTGYLIYETLY